MCLCVDAYLHQKIARSVDQICEKGNFSQICVANKDHIIYPLTGTIPSWNY